MSKAKEISLKQIEFINNEFRRICFDNLLKAEPVDVSFHLIKVSKDSSETRIFNLLSILTFLPNLNANQESDEIWKLLVATDPRSPISPSFYNVTFIDENSPYLEWRWIGDETVEKRFAIYVREHFPLFGWQKLKSAELYYQRKNNAPLWKWLKPLGFDLNKNVIQKWDNFIPKDEVFLFSSTGPSIAFMNDELEIPEKGWCRITRIEQVKSVMDQEPASEIDEITASWDEWLYYGLIIED